VHESLHDPSIFSSNPGAMYFGSDTGVHRCVGSHLARLELRVAVREWHQRIPEYWLKEGTELKYRQALREIPYLPLEFTAASSHS
jgi:cytochrome P450